MLEYAPMKLSIEVTRAHLRVFSTVCSNFVVVWVAGALIAKNPLVLTGNILLAILAWLVAVRAEEILEDHES